MIKLASTLLSSFTLFLVKQYFHCFQTIYPRLVTLKMYIFGRSVELLIWFWYFCELTHSVKEYPTDIALRKSKQTEWWYVAKDVSSFVELAGRSKMFIDKTMLIKEIVESPSKIILITFPRRWGKSVNLNMIKTFLEIEYSINKSIIPRHEGNNYNLFKHGVINFKNRTVTISERLKRPLLISEHDEFIESYQGKYPIINLNFMNIRSKTKTARETIKKVRTQISRAFKRYKYLYVHLLKSMKNNHNDTKKEKDAQMDYEIFKAFVDNEQQDLEIIQCGVRFLCKVLRQYHNQKVYVLFDEYDSPITYFYHMIDLNRVESEQVVDFFKGLLINTFVDNEYMEKGIITGVFRLGDLGFESMQELEQHHLLRTRFTHYYAFNVKEIKSLFEARKIGEKEQKEVLRWHGGYKIPGYPDQLLYCPLDIVDYANRQVLAGDWRSNDNIMFVDELLRLPRMRELFKSMLNKESMTMDPQLVRLNKQSMAQLHYLFFAPINYTVTDYDLDLVKAYLFASGYMTLKPRETRNLNDTRRLAVRLVNPGIFYEFSRRLSEYLMDQCIFLYSPIKEAKLHMRLFMNDNRTRHKEIQKSFSNLCRDFRQLYPTGRAEELEPTFRKYFISVMECFALELQYLRHFRVHVYPCRKMGAELVMIDRKFNRGIIMEVTFEQSPEEALRLAKRYKYVLDNYDHIKMIKFIGLNVVYMKKQTELIAETIVVTR